MITIVIPALNEEAAIGLTVRQVRAALEPEGIAAEILVVDDGSRDRTGSIAESEGARVLRHPAPGGYGRALKTGILAASHEIVGIIDADGTYPADRLPELYRMVAMQGFDMAVGARTGREYRGSFLKRPARRVFQWLAEYAAGTRIDDINSGLRAFRRELPLRYLPEISNGFSFTATITLSALLNGLFVGYVPIDYHPRIGKSHVRHVRDSLRSLQIIVENILYYNPLKLFLLLCQILGALAVLGVGLAVLASGPLAFGGAMLAAGGVLSSIVVAAIGFGAVRRGTLRSHLRDDSSRSR